MRSRPQRAGIAGVVRRPPVALAVSGRGRARACPSSVGARVDVGRARGRLAPVRAGRAARGQGSEPLDVLARAESRAAMPGSSCDGTSAPIDIASCCQLLPARLDPGAPRPRAAAPRPRRRSRRRGPAAIGIRFSIVIRSGGACQPKRSRKRGERHRGEVRARRRRGRRPRPARPRRAPSHVVGERDRLEQRADLVQAVGAPRADVEAEVDLRRARGRGAS